MTSLLGRKRGPKYDPIAEAEQHAAAARLSEARAAQATADIARLKAEAEARPLIAAAEREAARLQAEAATEAAERGRQNAEAERTDRAAKRRAAFDRIAPVAPLLVVNGAAMFGQISSYTGLAGKDAPALASFGVAALVAAAAEVISVYVGWHAHDALLRKDSNTAARLRRTAYLIAAVIAAVNYSHFTSDLLKPTGAAVIFGVCSLLSPWLWGLHTRRTQHVQLAAEGRVDTAGAIFGAERKRAFPVRTWHARRWSIDHGVSDPLAAWDGYKAERALIEAAERDAAPIWREPIAVRGFRRRGRKAAARRHVEALATESEVLAPLDLTAPNLTIVPAVTEGLVPSMGEGYGYTVPLRTEDGPFVVACPSCALTLGEYVTEYEAVYAAGEHDDTAKHWDVTATVTRVEPEPDPEPTDSQAAPSDELAPAEAERDQWAAELAGLTKKADVVLHAIRAVDGDPDDEDAKTFVPAAIEWASRHGAVVDRSYAYDVVRRHHKRLTAARSNVVSLVPAGA